MAAVPLLPGNNHFAVLPRPVRIQIFETHFRNLNLPRLRLSMPGGRLNGSPGRPQELAALAQVSQAFLAEATEAYFNVVGVDLICYTNYADTDQILSNLRPPTQALIFPAAQAGLVPSSSPWTRAEFRARARRATLLPMRIFNRKPAGRSSLYSLARGRHSREFATNRAWLARAGAQIKDVRITVRHPTRDFNIQGPQRGQVVHAPFQNSSMVFRWRTSPTGPASLQVIVVGPQPIPLPLFIFQNINQWPTQQEVLRFNQMAVLARARALNIVSNYIARPAPMNRFTGFTIPDLKQIRQCFQFMP